MKKPSQQNRIAGCQILNNKVGLQANKWDTMLTVVTCLYKQADASNANTKRTDYIYSIKISA